MVLMRCLTWTPPSTRWRRRGGWRRKQKGRAGYFFNTLQIQTTAIEIVIRLSGSSTPPHGSLLWRKSTRRFSIFSKLSFAFPSFLMFTLPLLAWWISQIIITIFCHYYDFWPGNNGWANICSDHKSWSSWRLKNEQLLAQNIKGRFRCRKFVK